MNTATYTDSGKLNSKKSKHAKQSERKFVK